MLQTMASDDIQMSFISMNLLYFAKTRKFMSK